MYMYMYVHCNMYVRWKYMYIYMSHALCRDGCSTSGEIKIPLWIEPNGALLVSSKTLHQGICNYNIVGLRRNISPGLDTVSVENIANYFRRARNYMFGYLLGHKAGIALETLIKNIQKTLNHTGTSLILISNLGLNCSFIPAFVVNIIL